MFSQLSNFASRSSLHLGRALFCPEKQTGSHKSLFFVKRQKNVEVYPSYTMYLTVSAQFTYNLSSSFINEENNVFLPFYYSHQVM